LILAFHRLGRMSSKKGDGDEDASGNEKYADVG
jgi:hypothetical protein